MPEFLPLTCKCAGGFNLPGTAQNIGCSKDKNGNPYPCRFFITTGTTAAQGEAYAIYGKYDCGGTLDCASSKCVNIGCRISKAMYCGAFGEGKVCPNLCDWWKTSGSGDGQGYTCIRWGRKTCTNEKCPATKETAPVPWTGGGTPPPPGPAPCGGKKCVNGFNLNLVHCTCDCNSVAHPCPAGQVPTIVGATEPKTCTCLPPGGNPPPTQPPPSYDSGIIDFINKNPLVVIGVSGLIALLLASKK